MAITRTRPLAGPVPHPGEVLKDELEARGLSAHALAIALRLPASRISQIVRGQRMVAAIACRLQDAVQLHAGFPCARVNILRSSLFRLRAATFKSQRL
jgi:transcriptional regulator with XRE-family HTH domain